MRFLQVNDQGKFSLTNDIFSDRPQYAIFSHTWGDDHEEVSFQDLMGGSGKIKAGYKKLQFCAEQAAHDGLRYFWIDTCCIDKSNNTEFSEAINSMFRWYRESTKCYVYLSDVSMNDCNHTDEVSHSWEPAFWNSRWFTRGWTLQELLAPVSVDFFSVEGKLLGSKKSLERQVQEITGISAKALRGGALSAFTVKERFSWAQSRLTKREEDQVYCLLGLFDVHMPPIYGEGKESALRRLWQEIHNRSRSYPLDELLLTSKNSIDPQERRSTSHSQSSADSFFHSPDVVDWLNFIDQCIGYKGPVPARHEAQFRAETQRLKHWAFDTGLYDHERSRTCDSRFRDPDLAIVVQTLLYRANELFKESTPQSSHSVLHTRDESATQLILAAPPLKSTENAKMLSASTARSNESASAAESRGQFIGRVERFKHIIDLLYSLVPPKPEAKAQMGQRFTTSSDSLSSMFNVN